MHGIIGADRHSPQYVDGGEIKGVALWRLNPKETATIVGSDLKLMEIWLFIDHYACHAM